MDEERKGKEMRILMMSSENMMIDYDYEEREDKGRDDLKR